MWIRLLLATLLASGLLGACQSRPAWEECVANHPLACTMVGEAALGQFMGSWPVDVAP
jgi:hypothetical protein